MNRKPVDFHQLLEGFSNINAWLSKRGIAGETRIRRYQANIEEMLKLSDIFEPSVVHADMKEKGRLSEILSTYVDSLEFVDTIKALQCYEVEIPPNVLRRICQGPVDASLEDEKSNASRNFMFELVIGAMIAAAGFRPTFSGASDIVFDFEGHRVLVECKRVMSVNKVEERIRKAVKQIKLQATGVRDLGLVAISITRTLNSGGVIWEIPSDSDIYPFLDSKLGEVIRRFDPLLQNLSHPNVVGVVFYISTPILVPGIGFSVVKRGILYPMPGAVDIEGLKRLTSMLHV